eukprot:TRINITY_DN14896_c0_g1_i1.p1 TRINITY_DN14896_c0_g1~~TRINITY_DN14896_c0_g1_i1.p1  ORF type:complete len:444 (-),score=93.81 TRINITY_DN14896_c0_g1_i1:1-1269(-)
MKRKRTQLSICYALSFTSLGFAISAVGPSLLALSKNTNATIGEIGTAVAVRSFGYLLGSVTGGPLFDRLNGNKIIAISLFATGIASFIIPEVKNLYLLGFLLSVQGIAMGFLDTGANVSILWLHGENASPYLQSLHMWFGIGASVAPMIVGGVMKVQIDDPTWAFRAFALFNIPIILWIWLFPQPKRSSSSGSATMGVPEKLIIVLVASFLFFDVGAELGLGGYLYSYSVLKGLAGETESAFLVSGFWGFLAVGRTAAVPISIYCSAAQILAGSIGLCIFSALLWIIFSNSHAVLWIGCVGYGLGIASFFPTSINLAENYVPLTGKLASLLVVGASFGEMLVPITVAQLFESRIGPNALMYSLLICNCVGLGLFLTILFVGKRTHKMTKKSDEVEEKVEEVPLVSTTEEPIEEMVPLETQEE